MKRKLRVVPGCRCQIAQNHYQKERDLTLNSTQQDRRQEPRSTASETTFITDDISTRRATPSLSIAHLRVDDNSRLWKTWISKHSRHFFSFPLGNQCWNHLCLVIHSWFVPKREKCVSKDIFCSPTTIVDDNNNKHRCRQCPSGPEHFPTVRTTYTHSYKVTAWCLLLLLRVVATKMKTLMPISAFGDEVSPKSIGIKVNIEIT